MKCNLDGWTKAKKAKRLILLIYISQFHSPSREQAMNSMQAIQIYW